MKAIIVAAGRGSRLVPHTDHYPKCFIPFAGATLLERQRAALGQSGVSEVVVVRGYKGENFDATGLRCFDNPIWAETNMVHSLLCAREAILDGDDWIISYGDILYESRVVQSLIDVPGERAVVIDTAWRALWMERFENPLDDAESLRLNRDGTIADIGCKVDSLDAIEGQYIGLLRFNGNSMADLAAFYDNAPDCADWLEGRARGNCHMTDLLRGLIHAGQPITAALIDGGWLEFDMPNDLALYQRLHEAGTLDRFWSDGE